MIISHAAKPAVILRCHENDIDYWAERVAKAQAKREAKFASIDFRYSALQIEDIVPDQELEPDELYFEISEEL